MAKVGRNDPCTCSSGKKYKKCCLDKKPRQQAVVVGSSEKLQGFHYDHEKKELLGLTTDGVFIKPEEIFSQTYYEGESGKEKVITRIQEKVIRDPADLMKYLSSTFDLIIGIDTNTGIVESTSISVSGIVHCVVQKTKIPTDYKVDFPWHGVIIFRNCPQELSEKFGWCAIIKNFLLRPQNASMRIAFVTDHDRNNHSLYNNRKMPILRTPTCQRILP